MRQSRPAAVFVWAVWAAMTVGAVWFVYCYGVDLPRADDWVNLPTALGEQPITLAWLWQFFNEHRLPMQRLLFIGITRLAGGDVRAGMFANAAMLSAAAAILILVARKLAGRTRWTDVLFPLVLLSFGQYVHLTWCFHLHFVSAILLVTVMVACVCLMPPTPKWWQLLLTGIVLLLLPLDGTTTLLLAMPMGVWYALATWRGCRAPRRQALPAGTTGTIVVGVLAWVVWAYLQGFPTGVAAIKSWAHASAALVAYAGTAWGAGAKSYGRVSGLLTLMMMGYGTLWALWQAWKGRMPVLRAAGLSAIIVGHVLLIAAVAVGRGQAGSVDAVMTARYATVLFPAMAAVYLALTAWASKIGRLIQVVMCLVAAILFIPSTRAGLTGGLDGLQAHGRLMDDLRAGMPVEAIATRDKRILFDTNVRVVPRYLAKMAQYHIGPFRDPAIATPAPASGLVRESLAPDAITAENMRETGPWEWIGNGKEPATLAWACADPASAVGMEIEWQVEEVPAAPGQVSRIVMWWQPADGKPSVAGIPAATLKTVMGRPDDPQRFTLLPLEPIRGVRLDVGYVRGPLRLRKAIILRRNIAATIPNETSATAATQMLKQ